MLTSEHAKYHQLSPKDVGLRDKCAIQIARTTSQTGEQFVSEVPVYPEDTREQLRDRMNFFLSIFQDRLEDENKAMLEAAQKDREIHMARTLAGKVRALEKRLERKKITQEQFDAELEKLNAEAAKGLALASEGAGAEASEDSASGDQVKEV